MERAWASDSMTQGPAMRKTGLLPPRRREPREIPLDWFMELSYHNTLNSKSLLGLGGNHEIQVFACGGRVAGLNTLHGTGAGYGTGQGGALHQGGRVAVGGSRFEGRHGCRGASTC